MATQLNDWLSIDKASGTGNAQITLTASSYGELVDRAASLKIQAQSTNAILNVRQKAYTPIEKNDNYFWVEFGGTNGTISGLTNDYTDMYHSFDGITWEKSPNTLSMGSNRLVYFKNNSKKISERKKELTISFNSNAKVGGDISSITDMADSACQNLFYNNEYLTDASELILPWNTLSQNCYSSMFEGCTSLTKAPVLPATTLVKSCYIYMFWGCTNLNYVKMLATENTTKDNLFAWLSGVSSTGTFVKHPDANIPKGEDGIPRRWTVETATE